MESVMQDFLFKQAPIVIILIIGLIWLYKILNTTLKDRETYFVGEIQRMYKIIDEKDDLIQKQNEKLSELVSTNNRVLSDIQQTLNRIESRNK